jgi:hypothetical protein
MRKTKQAKPTREEILKGMGWEPLKVPGVPRAVLAAENRRMQDDLVGWVQGLSAHIDKVDAAAKERKVQRKRAKASPRRPAGKKRPSSKKT